ncbi:MAG TPA: phage baseplate assembly protein V [Pyrinomonadaceae bacterium]|nr:phage baseplate assembly protein V [Pyrinomonadaceae bacterium]
MTMTTTLLDVRAEAQERARLYGSYVALVTDISDPQHQGRVRVRLPWMPDDSGAGYEAWARLATLMAGADRGTWFVPDVGDEVLVTFEAGDPRRPFVVGALWNGSDSPPERMDGAGNNYKKSIVSRAGVRVTLDDTDGQVSLTLETPQQSIELKDGGRSVEIKDANGNSIKLDASGVTITAAAKVSISAGTMEISAGMLTVNAGMSKFSGVVKSDTNITNSTISTSYTPGAGNIW